MSAKLSPSEAFDATVCIERLAQATAVAIRDLGRRGAVVAVSGGVDSAVVAAICARALGPEHDALPAAARAGRRQRSPRELGLELAPAARAPTWRSRSPPPSRRSAATGSGTRRSAAVFPDYEPGWRHKLVRSPPSGGMIVFSLVVERPDGEDAARAATRRLPPPVAATNMKQRVRKLVEYTLGRPASLRGRRERRTCSSTTRGSSSRGRRARRREADRRSLQESGLRARAASSGCRGDRLAPADHGDVQPRPDPGGVLLRLPGRDDGPAAVGQREGVSADEIAARTGRVPTRCGRGWAEIERRREATRYLHAPAVLVEPPA